VRARWLDAGIVLAAVVALALQTRVVSAGFLFGDFRAFYCASRVALQHDDPYLAQPLHACEAGLGWNLFFERNPTVTVPAPLPSYDLAALAPLALLPFAVAAAAWAAVLALACIVSVVALSRSVAASWQAAFAVLAIALIVASLPFGEVVPIALACICMAGYFARQQRWLPAALSAAGAMVEPHLGLPVCVALAIWVPAARIPLAVCGCALAALALAFLGPATNWEYVTSVLPAHALSEGTRDTQYSLTAALYSLGAPQRLALSVGSAWYAAMVLLGSLVGGRLAKSTSNHAFLAFAPPAFAALGGTFIHVTQIAAALPAAMLLVGTARPPLRIPAFIALLLLAVPWAWAISPSLVVAPLLPVAFLTWWYWHRSLRIALLVGIAAALLQFGATEAYSLTGATRPTRVAAPAIDPRLAEASWSDYSREDSTNSLAAWAVRIPTWMGLALLLALLTYDATQPGLQTSRAGGYLRGEAS
jgi:hypothetical protein